MPKLLRVDSEREKDIQFSKWGSLGLILYYARRVPNGDFPPRQVKLLQKKDLTAHRRRFIVNSYENLDNVRFCFIQKVEISGLL